MMKRFRMVAGPNGSGKSTLADLLRRDYAVNFYAMLRALSPGREGHGALDTLARKCGSSIAILLAGVFLRQQHAGDAIPCRILKRWRICVSLR